jgi:hypothetical protein
MTERIKEMKEKTNISLIALRWSKRCKTKIK